MDGVRLTEIVEKMNLKNLTPGVDITERKVHGFRPCRIRTERIRETMAGTKRMGI